MEDWLKTTSESQKLVIVNEKDDTLYQHLMKENSGFSFYLFDYSKPVHNLKSLQSTYSKASFWFDVTTNNEPTLINLLCQLGLNFTCFNYPEAKMIRAQSKTARISITNSLLNKDEIQSLPSMSIDSIRVGSIEQVDIIKTFLPNVSIILDVSSKRFGLNTAQAYEVIKECKSKQANLVGIYSDEKSIMNFSKILGLYSELFQKEGFSLTQIFYDEFGMKENVNIVNEISNQYSFNACVYRTLINNYLICFDWVIQEKIFEDTKQIHYHVHNLEFINGMYFEGQEPFKPSDRFIDKNEKKYLISVYGPTCDGANYLVRDYPYAKLPPELRYIVIENIGCNSIIYGGSKFNGFDYSETTKLIRVFNKYTI